MNPAGEMSSNTCVTVREWRVLADGTRRAHVCEVGSSPEKSGWLSCVEPGTVPILCCLPTPLPTPLRDRSSAERGVGTACVFDQPADAVCRVRIWRAPRANL